MFKGLKNIFNKCLTGVNGRLFGYLNKADFLMVATTIPLSIVSLSLQSISTHLDRKIARQQQLQIKPLNYLQVQFIPYEAYHAITTNQSWNSRRYMEINQSSLLHEEQSALPVSITETPNNANNATATLQQKNTNNIVDKVSNLGQQLSNTTNQYVDKLKQNTSADSKPPMQQTQKEEEIEYFIVQDSNGKTYDPNEVRRSGKKQNVNYKKDKNGRYVNTLNQNHKVVGKIGGKEIEHETLKETIVNIVYGALHIKKRKTYGVVFDTRYDAYGRLIKHKSSSQQNAKQTQQSKANDSHAQTDKYMPKFILDGTLQQQVKSNSLQSINDAENYTPAKLKMLINLEYLFENCWINYAKKYQNTNLSYTYQVMYDKDTKTPIKVNFVSKHVPDDIQHMATEMKNDIKKTILNCNIKEVEGLSNQNYDFWKKIEITFSGVSA